MITSSRLQPAPWTRDQLISQIKQWGVRDELQAATLADDMFSIGIELGVGDRETLDGYTAHPIYFQARGRGTVQDTVSDLQALGFAVKAPEAAEGVAVKGARRRG
jgi:hypothetical protein